MARPKGLLTTGDLARRTGNTLRTVRFYEEEGLVVPARRSRGGHRLFGEDQLHKLRLITDLRNIGLSIPVIKEVFQIKRECKDAVEASERVNAFLQEQIARMEEQVALLQRVRDEFRAAMAVFHECASCKDVWIRRRCASCEVMARESLSPSVRMIWLTDTPASGENASLGAPRSAG
jgi:DNA-binding transcriptional MerR regulator